MLRYFLLFVFGSISFAGVAQNAELPTDFRQHNLNQINSSLFNPTFSLDRNLPRSLALWSRWQWQSIDGDPTTLFVNYTQKLNETLAGGLGFLQHNTGIYLQTGLNLNIAWAGALDDNTTIYLGVNIFSFDQKLADEQLILLPESELQSINTENSFSTQISPGIRLTSNTFSVGVAVQNAVSLTLSGPDNPESNGSVVGFVSNDFPFQLWGNPTFFRPQLYLNAISGFDTQVGINALLGHPQFWVQGGYNNFYGPSLGLGVTLAKKIAIGGLLEFPTDNEISEEDPTFELTVSYFIGKQTFAKKPQVEEEPLLEEKPMVEEKPLSEEKIEPAKENKTVDNTKDTKKAPEVTPKRPSRRQLRIQEKRRQDSIDQAIVAANVARKEKNRLDSIARAREQQRRIQAKRDSIAREKSKEMALLREKARQDSIAQVELNKDVVLLPNERYEEVAKEDGLEPGFYLIANVFGTKRYYENFMKTLKGRGLSPGSFYRSVNGYNYVYLQRYNSINEARKARDSKFNGKYQDKLWIFRIR